MRENIERPNALVDVTGLSREIEDRGGGGILIGAPGQIRSMATVGGNLPQRTRCYYFYVGSARYIKRVPGAGCDAVRNGSTCTASMAPGASNRRCSARLALMTTSFKVLSFA